MFEQTLGHYVLIIAFKSICKHIMCNKKSLKHFFWCSYFWTAMWNNQWMISVTDMELIHDIFITNGIENEIKGLTDLNVICNFRNISFSRLHCSHFENRSKYCIVLYNKTCPHVQMLLVHRHKYWVNNFSDEYWCLSIERNHISVYFLGMLVKVRLWLPS